MQTNTTAHQASHRLPAPAARPVPAGTLSEAEIRQIVRETLG